MRGVNKVILIGNATRDTELHFTKSGKPVANMRLATNRLVTTADGTRQEQVQYHTVICWDRLAEITNEYVHKGKPVYVEGRLETRQFTDKQGRERELAHIVASEVQFLGSGQGTAHGGDAASSEGEPAEPEEANLDEVPL